MSVSPPPPPLVLDCYTYDGFSGVMLTSPPVTKQQSEPALDAIPVNRVRGKNDIQKDIVE